MCRPTCAATIPPARFKGMAADSDVQRALAGEFWPDRAGAGCFPDAGWRSGQEPYGASSGWRALALTCSQETRAPSSVAMENQRLSPAAWLM